MPTQSVWLRATLRTFSRTHAPLWCSAHGALPHVNRALRSALFSSDPAWSTHLAMATICTTLELRHVVAQASRDGYPVLILALSGQHHGLEVHWLQLSTAETPYLRVVAHMAVSELLAKVGGRCLLPLPMLSESDAVDLMASGSRGAREWVFRKYLQSR